MLMLPLSFFIVFALGVFLVQEFRSERHWTPSRKAFAALTALFMLQATLFGLVWSYEFAALRPIMPVAASLLPPLTWMSFRSLVTGQALVAPRRLALMLIPSLVIIGLVFSFPDPIDLILILIFLGYGVALWQMAGAGPDALHSAQLHQSQNAMHAMKGAAALLVLNAAVDAAIIADYKWTGGQNVPNILSVISLFILFAIGAAVATGTNSSDETPSDEPAPAGLQPTEDHRATVQQIETFLRSSRLYADPNLTLIRIARKLGMPARDISAAINRHHGMNVSQYVNGFRLNEACRLLDTTDQSITEIHLDAGFQTKSNFNREFRRQYGCSPTEWRLSRRKG